ncbi:hypothetical protein Celaphus_00000266 [Cervus elaphus hippelaphus]|uniref:Uncharacterized protein n=1 Tax=Cervus elaphus hippelaphus TaxID=46360 RepID=A0A212D987_CEREH|nr:hypothetical protein Celaphus_00000266 [Cervus elaphus hippelaphus]
MRYTGIQYTFIDKMPQVLGKEILKIDFGRNSEAKTGNLDWPFSGPQQTSSPKAVSHDEVVPLWPQHPSCVPSCYARVTSLL